MTRTPRGRFILASTLSYAVLALAWIFLSDRLLALFTDVESIVWLSTAKGVFFVVATSALLFVALRTVPSAGVQSGQSVLGSMAAGVEQDHKPHWFVYPFAVLLPLTMLAMRLGIGLGEQTMLILLMLPVILSALLGGLGPGLVATVVAALGADYLAIAPLHSWRIAASQDLLQWVLLIVNGVAVSLLSDVLRRSQARAEDSRRLLDAVVSGTQDAVFVKDLQGRYVMVNAAMSRILGKPPEAIVGQDDRMLFASTSAQSVMEIDRAILADGSNQTHEETLTTPDGQTRVFLVSKGPIFDSMGAVKGLFGISHDITERKAIAQQLQVNEQRLARVIEGSDQGYWDWNLQTNTFEVSARWETMLGYAPGEIQVATENWPHLVHPDDFPLAMASVDRHVRGESSSHELEMRLRTKSGEWRWILTRGRIVSRSEDGRALMMSGTHTDISQFKLHEAELDRMAHYDPLTGAPNRRLLSDRLAQAIVHAGRSGKSLAVSFLDLDGFKAINDQFGHVAGDQLLIGVAENLKHVLRADDTLARLGGDEFVLLLADIASPEECSQVLDRVLHAVTVPVTLENQPISVSASIGVSLYPQDHADADTLLRHADQAMYIAKEAGKNRYHLFDPESDRKAQAHRQYLEVLRQALQNDEFVLYYQPKVDLHSGAVLGAEALIRWRHPEQGVLAPAAFLPHINGSDLEIPLGEWVMETALDQLTQWHAAGLAVAVSVNVGAHQLMHPNFYDSLRAALQRRPQVPPACFELEVLETAAIADMEHAIGILQRCRALGVHFALDDFGTGYSSLTYLRKLPVDILKIDQSFVRDMLTDPDDRGIVEGVIHLAAAFHRPVIAEGVETLAHGAALLQLGCKLAQGYGIARPMPAVQFVPWVAQWRADAAWQSLRP